MDIQGQKYETELLIDIGFTTSMRYGEVGSQVSLLASFIGHDFVRVQTIGLSNESAFEPKKSLIPLVDRT